LIDWCLTPTLAVFQLYRGGHIYILVNKYFSMQIWNKNRTFYSCNKIWFCYFILQIRCPTTKFKVL